MPDNTPRGYTYPLYGDANNFPAQIQDFAQDVDLDVAAQVTAINTALNAPSARAHATAVQAIPVATDTYVTFAVEDYDNAAMVNLGVNNDRITFTSTGIYLINGEVNFASNGNGTLGGRRVTPGDNVALEIARDTRFGSSFADVACTVTYLHRVTALPDFIRLRVTHTSGAAVNVNLRSLSVTKVAL